ncbi:cell wall hydrolase [Priestia megaterium]|uniref:cell wall hydrolase n=1 Tax=Priestia megaterium TaxID=1404 RepID=UPI0023DA0EEF|nr:cell wall hydrolase [Priestia megaterium]MDF2010225.1 cell wall hydrolase [Priestia megaterium]
MKDLVKKIVAPAVVGVGVVAGASPSFAYTVQEGDTMSGIAKKNNMSLNELASKNPNVKNLDLIYSGQNINTDNSTNVNTNTKVEETTSTPVKENTSVSSYEKDLMSRLVQAEASDEPYAGKVAVAYVVLNRVDSGEFPNSISSVINQPGQFTPVSNGMINNTPSEDSKRAVNEALNADRSKGAGSLFFYNPRTASSRWLDSRPTTTVIGNHVFKK